MTTCQRGKKLVQLRADFEASEVGSCPGIPLPELLLSPYYAADTGRMPGSPPSWTS